MGKDDLQVRLVVTGGGTGGHIYPALAIAKGWLERHPGSQVLYLGTAKGLEKEIVPREGLPFETVSAEGFSRQISLGNLGAVFKTLKGLGEAMGKLRAFRPDLVVGTGGFVCGPVVLAASLLGIPTAIHEQNAYPGITNRLLASRVDRVLLTFEEARSRFRMKDPKKAILTGLPVRQEILEAQREEGARQLGLDPKAFTLLIAGGSRGALSINRSMVELMGAWAGRKDCQILHVTGEKTYQETLKFFQEKRINFEKAGNIKILPYLHGMAWALACADLCVLRAGATTLAELTLRGIPAILVPYPHAAENHQEFNARALADQGAARWIRDRELTGEKLLAMVEELRQGTALRQEMADKARKMGKPQALADILDNLDGIVRR